MTMPQRPHGLEPLRDTIARHGLDARKALGQHFLLDPGITARIAALAGDLAGQHVVEVGPGPGGLTRALLDTKAASIIAVEVDPRAVAVITELAAHAPERLQIIEADAMRRDLTTLCPAPRQIIANLPYNVGTPLLVGWLRQASAWSRLTLMFQQEVAERICAAPGSDHYGRLGVLAQWTCRCGVMMHIPPGAFSPPPKVHSAVVGLIPHAQQPDAALFRAMEQVTAAAFGQRRKMLRGALKSIGGEALLAEAGIEGSRRAETLEIADFDRLARLHARRSAAVA
ncbi:16S rRNA (adenine(1518)-N(6)/adenine(1519)-N(6))-dimethyltransferase [Komagataeibacter nataicola]|uniref:Ribosomal RNA small subunit methyltransferase A n=1 Tax=Komagataeibacter nataicola TaxID=265960 RepID=A0A9N7CM30_9PROT|nr:16S rRNA (adenine(1518)-N(6)/adenine(1519)-N(6))-dimethyltransferase RsmA [Komagataeibacter nataicola]AQU86884.1 16S rRNA (adenine(1518)-N(6)/adenine(1519)-N(6))-dimethyltransferase [Komagataeibacter nataicola]PYD67901.1 16S rRNA (adenine(1518)-N(6)/adenine(1519)-N(6))-dimethyltransferase [Komagataeibacter nataicola]WEQ56163.1 16S rRNA (adenine(1518)-N(6)/adenine(1519)-N(6))-dimethyltransferase RsmA [Komagataeibacter nataicola]WNM07761.1 16S rRNA (adenine(1518)-N(6)/adenine(1519)-N(6))-dimet